MLALNNLLEFAKLEGVPAEKRRGIVREYIQTIILSCIQKSEFGAKTIFIGGTALRFFYNLKRFSEDLDFNYEGILDVRDVRKLTVFIKKELENEGIKTEIAIRKSKETYFHWKIYVQIPEILQFYGCAGKKTLNIHPQEKLSVQIDFQNLGKKKYPIEKRIISKFEKRFIFKTTPLDMFLAEKSNTMLFRKPPRGRDFFDFMSIVFAGAKINRNYLKRRDIIVKNDNEYFEKITQRIKEIDFKKLTKQIEPFLFLIEDVEIMKNFDSHLKEIKNRLIQHL